MKARTPKYHAATNSQRRRFELAVARCLNRWAAVLDIESWDLEFTPLYGKTAQEYNKNRGQDEDWGGFHMTGSAAYRQAQVRTLVVNTKGWHMDEEELDRSSLHELLHVVFAPVYEECVAPYIEGNADQTKQYRFLDEYVTTQLERSIYRVAGSTRAALRKNGRRA